MSVLAPEMHPLLTSEVLEKLRCKNVHTIHQFVDADLKQLSTATNLTYKNVLTIRKHILNKNAAITKRADEYYQELLKRTAIISTGIKSFDNILDGGFYTGNIYEICGIPCSGKTQFCYTLLVKYATTYKQNILYIDAKHDFSPTRLNQIIGTDNPDDTLKNILIQQVNTPHELINSLYEIKDNQGKLYRFRMIIIDSLPALIYQNEGNEKMNMSLNSLVNIMRFLAVEYHIAFLVTNTITTWRESVDFAEKCNVVEKIGCRKFWRSVPNTRLKICKGDTEQYYEISVLKSSQVKEGQKCNVKLDESGIS